MTKDTLIRAAHGMIRHHGKDAEIKAAERADNVEHESQDAARHWREVAQVVRVLRTRDGPSPNQH
jgi:hypothetical protein